MTPEADQERRPGARRLLAIFVVSLVVYNANLRWIGALDTLGARYLPFSILTTGTPYLDRLFPLDFDPSTPDHQPRYYWLHRTPAAHLVSIYPIVIPILTAPLYLPAVIFGPPPVVGEEAFERVAKAMEKIAASIVASLSVVLFHLLLRHFTTDANAILLTIAYGFGTETWVIGSQALWMHGMSELLLIALLLELSRARPASCLWAGLFAALLVANRPQNLFLGVAAAFYVIVHNRSQLLRFTLFPLVVGSALLAHNWVHFGSVLGGYGVQARFSGFLDAETIAGLGGLLISPAKGLFVFSPFLLFLPFSWRAPATSTLRRLMIWFGIAAVVEVFFYAHWHWWAGGHSYGPRMLTDLMPIFVLGLVPAMKRLARPSARMTFRALVSFSVAVQAIGAFCYPLGGSDWQRDVWRWSNVQYVVELRGALDQLDNLPRWIRGAMKTFPSSLLGSAVRPLPDGAFRCQWGENDLPSHANPESLIEGSVTVGNTGEHSWPDGETTAGPRGSVRLSYEWLDAEGRVVEKHRRRFDLTKPVPPGETATFAVKIRTPSAAGRYRLKLGLLQEGYGRFEDKGAPVLIVPVIVSR